MFVPPETASSRLGCGLFMRTTVALAHATGFCGGVWRPVISSLSDEFTALTWDFPNHGAAPRLEAPVDWWDLATYILDQVAGAGRPLIGVGHSMGGAATLMAEIKAPGTFSELLLIEPIIFPPPYGEYEGTQVRLARKRREHFGSRQEARDNFAAKLPFSAWHPEALEGYLDCGLIETAEGTRLACRPQDEVAVYKAATEHRLWDLLPGTDVPVTILAGEESDTHPSAFLTRLAGRIPNSDFEIVPGTGHFLPMEMPGLVADRITVLAARATRPADP